MALWVKLVMVPFIIFLLSFFLFLNHFLFLWMRSLNSWQVVFVAGWGATFLWLTEYVHVFTPPKTVHEGLNLLCFMDFGTKLSWKVA